MSNATEPRPASPPETETPAPSAAVEEPPSEGEPHRHPFHVESEDWRITPPKVQVAFVEALTEVERLSEIIRFLIGDKYGKKSEKSKKDERQESGEPELPEEEPQAEAKGGAGGAQPPDAPEPDLPPPPPPPPPGLGRKPLPSHLPRRRVILDVPTAEKVCECCGDERPSFLSEDDASERYGYIPAQLFVWRYLRRKYGDCPCRSKQGRQSPPQHGTVPAGKAGVAEANDGGETVPEKAEASCEPLIPVAVEVEHLNFDSVPSNTAPTLATDPVSTAQPELVSSVVEPTPVIGSQLATVLPTPWSQQDQPDAAPGEELEPPETHGPSASGPECRIATAATPESEGELIATSCDIPKQAETNPPCSSGPEAPLAAGPTSVRQGELPAPSGDILKALLAPVVITVPSTKAGADHQSVVVASPLPQLIRKGLPSHGLLVQIIVSKVRDGMPLYRQAAQFLRSGVDLKPSTMSGWLIKVGLLLAPMMAALRVEVLSGRCVHIDETPFDVLVELLKKATAQAYMWVFAGGQPGRLAVQFRYDSSRSADVPRQYLEGYTGDVLTDGYAGYDFLLKWVGIVLMGCWVHVRRKFHDVIKALPAKFRGKNTIASEALARIRVLYRLEKYADQHNFTEDQRRVLRQQRAKPIIDSMKTWLEEVKPKVPAKTKLGEAIGYALNQWSRLEHYVNEGYRPLDNNFIENLIRPFAIGRKAWLFCATEEGAVAMATFHSLIATAVVNGLDPYKYMRVLFDQFAILLETAHPIHGPTPEQCRTLLPQYMDRALLNAELPESRLTLAALIGMAEEDVAA